jgi:D-alanyl-D-alanine carboxypeptidase
MEKPFVKTFAFWILFLTAGALLGNSIYQGFLIQKLRLSFTTVKEDFASTTLALEKFSSSTTENFAKSELRFVSLSDMLYEEQGKLIELSDTVKKFSKQVSKLTGNVETLEKLTTTDPELLQKYSKVYFLNEHYKPTDLKIIGEKYDLVDGKQVSIHSEVLPFLEDLIDEAREDKVNLMVLSGYRSFAEQTTLKDAYRITYGLGSNQFSADQGYSEHQLGTTVDFTTQAIGQDLSLFEGSDAHNWLVANAHKYGFVMSYPKNNEYYVYEPWHWRFVGRDLARDLNRKEKYFYDLEQREIDSYIAELFD